MPSDLRMVHRAYLCILSLITSYTIKSNLNVIKSSNINFKLSGRAVFFLIMSLQISVHNYAILKEKLEKSFRSII